jgi:hypothetical protein
VIQEVLLCVSHRFWHYWRTIPLLRRTGCDIFDASDDSEGNACPAHYMEEEDRR